LTLFKFLKPDQQRNLLMLFVAGLLFWLSLASLLTTMSIYVQDVGGTNQDVGIVMGAFAIGLLLSRSWLGKLADQRSRRIVLLIGMGVVAIAPLGYLLVQLSLISSFGSLANVSQSRSEQVVLFLALIRAFHGISIAAFTTAYSALVVDYSPVERRGELIGHMSLVNPLGVGIGPTLGSFVYQVHDYTALFILSATLGLVGLGIAAQVQDPSHSFSNWQTPVSRVSSQTDLCSTASLNHSPQFWKRLLDPRLRVPSAVMLMVGCTFGTLSTFLPLFVQQVDRQFNPGLFYTIAALTSFSARMFMGPASDRYGRGPFITLSLFFYIGSMAILCQAQDTASILVAAAIEGVGAGILIPTMAALMADRAHAHERGQMFSLCMGGFDLGIALAGPCLGEVATAFGYRFVFGSGIGFCCLALILFTTQSGKDLMQSWHYALGLSKDPYAVM